MNRKAAPRRRKLAVDLDSQRFERVLHLSVPIQRVRTEIELESTFSMRHRAAADG